MRLLSMQTTQRAPPQIHFVASCKLHGPFMAVQAPCIYHAGRAGWLLSSTERVFVTCVAGLRSAAARQLRKGTDGYGDRFWAKPGRTVWLRNPGHTGDRDKGEASSGSRPRYVPPPTILAIVVGKQTLGRQSADEQANAGGMAAQEDELRWWERSKRHRRAPAGR